MELKKVITNDVASNNNPGNLSRCVAAVKLYLSNWSYMMAQFS